MTERFVEANRIRLQCVQWGSPRRPAVLLVHGWDGTARYWDLVAPALSDRYHLAAVTLRGRGRSGVDPTGRYRFDDHVSDLHEVTRRLGRERFAFVGASLGGMLALPYTARYPRRVERLILGDIGAQLGGDRPSSYYAGMLAAPDTFGSRDGIERWLRQWSLYVKLPRDGMAVVLREHFQKARDGSWAWRFAGRLRGLQRAHPREVLFPPQWHTLSRIRCPVLIVRGGRSESLLPGGGRADARRSPRRAPGGDSGLQSLPVPGAPAGVRRAAPRVPPVACVRPAAAAPEPAPAPPGA